MAMGTNPIKSLPSSLFGELMFALQIQLPFTDGKEETPVEV
jgi:hypothetical protein